jgi:hypothetical protein
MLFYKEQLENTKSRKRFIYGALQGAEDKGLESPRPKGGGYQVILTKYYYQTKY